MAFRAGRLDLIRKYTIISYTTISNKTLSCRRDRTMLRVIKYFNKSLKITEGHLKWHLWNRRVGHVRIMSIKTASVSRTVSELFSVK